MCSELQTTGLSADSLRSATWKLFSRSTCVGTYEPVRLRTPKRLSLAEMWHMARKERRKRFPGPAFFITGKDKGKLSYFWEHVYLKAKSDPNLGGVVNPDSGVAILDSEMQNDNQSAPVR